MAPKDNKRNTAMRPQDNQNVRPGLPQYSPRHLSPDTSLRLFSIVTVANTNGKRPHSEVAEGSSANAKDEMAPAPRPTKRPKPNQCDHGGGNRHDGLLESSQDPRHATPSQPTPVPTESDRTNQSDATGHSGPQPKGKFGLYFSNVEEVNADNAIVFRPAPDNTLPKSDEERQALVKRLVDAICYVDPALTEPNTKAPPKAFQNRWVQRTYYSPVQIEKAAWEVANETQRLYTQGWTRVIHDDGLMNSIVATRDWKFSERVDEIVSLLQVGKKLCESLLKGEKLWSIIGIPKALKSRSETNKKQNARRQVRLDIAKQAEPNNNGKAKDVTTTGSTVATSVVAQSTSNGGPDSTIPATSRPRGWSEAQPPRQPEKVSEEVHCTIEDSPLEDSQLDCVDNRESNQDCPHQDQTTAMIPCDQDLDDPQPDVSQQTVIGAPSPEEPHELDNEASLDQGGCSAPETGNLEDILGDGSHETFVGASAQEEHHVAEDEAPLDEGGCSAPDTVNRENSLAVVGTNDNFDNAPNVDESTPHYENQGSISSYEDAAVTLEAPNASINPGEMHPSNAPDEYNDPSSGEPSNFPFFAEGESSSTQTFLEELDELLDRELPRMDAARSPEPARFMDEDKVVYQAAQHPSTWAIVPQHEIPKGFTRLTTCGSKRSRDDDEAEDDVLDGAQQGPPKKKTCLTTAQSS